MTNLEQLKTMLELIENKIDQLEDKGCPCGDLKTQWRKLKSEVDALSNV